MQNLFALRFGISITIGAILKGLNEKKTWAKVETMQNRPDSSGMAK